MAEQESKAGQELVIGLVGAIGTDLSRVEIALQRAFKAVNYTTQSIKLIDKLPAPAPKELARVDQRYARKMDAGNEFRKLLQRKDALALLGVAAIRNARYQAHQPLDKNNMDRPIERCAYILHSLKTPDEIKTLRRVYGNNFLVVAAYAPRSKRVDVLAEKFKSYGSTREQHRADAERLVERDGKEHGESFGQNVQAAFWLADVFVDASKVDPGKPAQENESIDKDVLRFVKLLFGHPFETPTRDEHGMFQAYGSGLRSASAGRQVGAAITRTDGDVVSTGTNEVAKPDGGQYWSDDGEDNRDHRRSGDSNEDMARNIIVDFLVRLQLEGWFNESKKGMPLHELQSAAEDFRMEDGEKRGVMYPFRREIAESHGLSSLAENARVKRVIEYIRAVHAEMAALMSAARRGVAVDGCTLYSTAFPCHECAKHIVMAGIRRVVFIEPYPKSRAADLYDDSIDIDATCEDGNHHKRVPFVPFVGIAPRMYMDLFSAPERKDEKTGKWIEWEQIRQTQTPRLGGDINTYVEQEEEAATMLEGLIKANRKLKEVIAG
ncbi:MAG: hypothetical protein IPM54_21675 [Polyangiaceae bacterium]|nr:hypothetical protein [Polyangiaceae bacterium]